MDTISGELESNPFLVEESPVAFREEWSAPKPRSYLSDFNFEDTLQDTPSLMAQIETQITLNFHDLPSQSIARHMVLFLDEAGYFRADLDDLALKLGTTVAHLEDILHVLQSFDPPGIFARDLKECFKIQLEQQDQITPLVNNIIDKLDFLVSGNMKDLLKASGSNIEQVQDVIQKLRTLDPKPGFQSGAQIGAFTSGNIIPDIYLDIDENGKWSLALNPDLMPRLSLHQDLFQKSMSSGLSKNDEGFIRDKFSTASGLIKLIQQRNETLLRIANEVVQTQRLFFTQGIHFLRPLTLRKVAEQLDVHESTISRGCSNKYLATPRGTFELKFFFQSGVTDTDGDAVSSAQIIHKIKDLVANETPQKPHSDEYITTMLNSQGIQVARRTIAKYREEAGIPSSSVRKRQKSF
jgi:RNA polymerase sigma-54 factor